MENSVEKVQVVEKSTVELPDYGPLSNFDLLVQKKISNRVYKTVKNDLPQLISDGLTFEQLNQLVSEYNLPHSLLFDFKKLTAVAPTQQRVTFKKWIYNFFVNWPTRS